MKKILSIASGAMLLLLLLAPDLSFAQVTSNITGVTPITRESTSGGKLTTKEGSASSKVANTQANSMENLRARADQEITRRVKAMTFLINRINALKRLSADQKFSLTSQVQAQIDSLNALKIKIDADSDIKTLKIDVKSIVTSYRIYALFIPQIAILTASDGVLDAAEKFNVYIAKLQVKITAVSAGGADVTALQASLADMQNKVNDAVTQAQNASSSALPLTPAGYPGNKTVLTSSRTSLMNARKDLQAARNDALSIIQGLKTLNSGSSSAKPITPISTSSANQ